MPTYPKTKNCHSVGQLGQTIQVNEFDPKVNLSNKRALCEENNQTLNILMKLTRIKKHK